MFACLCVCHVEFFLLDAFLVCHLMVNNGVFRFWPRGWECALRALFDRWLPISFPCLCSICMCSSLCVNVWACKCLCTHLHSHTVCVCLQRDECAISPRGGQKAHTCRRSAESITEKQEQRERRDETENRGVSLCPQTLLFQAFLIISRKSGTIHTHILTWSTHQHRQLFQQIEEGENQRVERWGEGGMGWKIRTAGEIKYLIPFSLHSSSTTFTLVWCKTCINTAQARGSFSFSTVFFSPPTFASYVSQSQRKVESQNGKLVHCCRKKNIQTVFIFILSVILSHTNCAHWFRVEIYSFSNLLYLRHDIFCPHVSIPPLLLSTHTTPFSSCWEGMPLL